MLFLSFFSVYLVLYRMTACHPSSEVILFLVLYLMSLVGLRDTTPRWKYKSIAIDNH
jgi:hypothetical protein